MKNGNPDHDSTDNLAGPIVASSSNDNIEDGNFHEVKIAWDAATKELSVFFDCQLRLTITEDIKNTIFFGDSSVYFGFVGATGSASNLQQVCFNSISFVDNLVIPENETICLGQEINIDTTIPSGINYSWSPTTGVSDANIANPDFSPIETTDYTVTITDNCGELTNYTVTITVSSISTPIFTQIDPICSGEVLSDLPVISNNGITGTWLPAINNTAITTYTFTPDASETCAVIQSMTITVSSISTPIFTQIDPICSGEALSDLPVTSNNGITGTWLPAINNTATTTYTFIPSAGECSTDPAQMTVIVNAIITPTLTQVGAICNGEALSDLPVISNNGITGTWSPALNNTATTTYSFVPDPGGSCAEPTTLEIVVNEIINLNMIVNVVASKFTNNQSIEVDVTNTNGSNEYKLNNGLWQDSNLFESLIVGKHIVAAREKSGCSIESNIWFLLIDYPRFFTPNNDGVNDTWNIAGLESQPEAVITVFDRYGKALSVFRADSLGWNGVSKGKGLPSASYWFKVQYFEMEKRPKTRISYFSLVR
jgi:gliding motility-associated-like protein